MATPRRPPTHPVKPAVAEPTPVAVVDRLFTEGASFDFFQAVRLLQALDPGRARVGIGGPPSAEAVRFRTLASLSFPASSIHELAPPTEVDQPPELIQAFLGLTGPNGVLPRHYTELIIHLGIERRDAERYLLADWLNLFNHRFVSLFYRAWEKYRAFLEPGHPRMRGAANPESDAAIRPFEASLLSLVGLGTPALRDRLEIRPSGAPAVVSLGVRLRSAPRVDDSTLIFYAGLIRQQTRSAAGLEAILGHHFGLEVQIQQFQGRWLNLAESSQSRLQLPGETHLGNRLGINTVLGERVWDIQGFFRVRIGPLTYPQFASFVPDPSRREEASASFLAAQIIRFYAGPELDFDIQLVLKAGEVPRCLLPTGNSGGPILGWNSWLANDPFGDNPDDAAFVSSDLGV